MEQDPKTPEKAEGKEESEAQSPTAVAESDAAAEEKEEKKVVPFEVVAREEKEDSTAELTLHIPYEEYDRELNELFEELRKSVQLPGFRKGKAPPKLIKTRFQKDAQKDALGKLVPSCLEQLVEKESLRLLGEPTLIEEATKIEEAKHVEVKVALEIYPNLELKSYKDLNIEIHTHEIGDKLVDDQLDHIRKSNAAYEAKSGDKFEEEDALVVDIRVEDDRGQAIGNMCREDLFLRTPKSALPEAVYSALAGKKRGDTVEVTVDFERKNRVGEVLSKKDQYRVTIKEIKTAKLPELDDEFAKDLGEFKDIKALRDHIRADLERHEENRQRDEALTRIHGQLVDLNPVRAPKTLVAAQQLDQLQDDSQMFRQMGMNLGDLGEEGTKNYLERRRGDAERAVKLHLILDKIAETEKLEVTDADIEDEIKKIAEQAGRKPLAIRAKLEAEKKLEGFRRDLVIKKVADFLIGHSKIEKRPATEAHAH